MDKAAIERAVRRHDKFWEDQRPHLEQLRNFYADDAWNLEDRRRAERAQAPLVQINRIRPWAISYESSLFYKSLRSEVRQDDVIRPEDPPDLNPDAIVVLLDRWLNTEDFQEISKQAYGVALIYPQAAFYLGLDGSKDPLDRPYCELMKPWECLWEPRASKRHAPYWGRISTKRVDELRRLYGATGRLPMDRDLQKIKLPDYVKEGLLLQTADGEEEDESYVRVLELWDLTSDYVATTTATTEDGQTYELDVTTRGTFYVYLLDQDRAPWDPSYGSDDRSSCLELVRGAPPFRWPNQEPCVPIVPIVLAHMPEFELWGISPASPVLELSSELNHIATYLAQAFRKEAARKLLVLAGKLNEETKRALRDPIDTALVEIEVGDGELERIMKWMDSPQVPDALLQYRTLLDKGMEDADVMAPVTRGTPTQYVSATESEHLVQYSETKIGNLREGVDKAIAKVGQVYVRLVDHALEDAGQESVRLLVAGQPYTLTSAHLQHRWKIRLVESVNTPAKEMKRRLEITQVLPVLQQLVLLAAGNPSQGIPAAPPIVIMFVKRMFDILGDLYDLGDDMTYDRLLAQAETDASVKKQVTESGQAAALAQQAAAEAEAAATAGQGGQGGAPASEGDLPPPADDLGALDAEPPPQVQ